MVETALVLMIIVLFTFGITEFGRAMYTKNMLNNAARAGARKAVVAGVGNLSLPKSYANLPNLNSTDPIEVEISKTLTYVKEPRDNVIASVTGSGGGTAVSGDTITVTVTFNNFTPVVAIMRNLISPTLVGQASMRYE